MDFGGLGWTLIKILGVVVLVAVIAYAMLRNRAEPKSDVTEQATRRVYEEEDEAHRGESDNVI